MARRQVRHSARQGFALRLHEALLAEGLTTENFARRIDKTLRTVQRWRAGETEPNGADLVAVAEALGRDPAWFYSEDEAVA